MKQICNFISRYMGVLVLITALVSLFFPQILANVKPRVINPLLGVVMFGMGLTLKAEDFKVVFSRPKDVIIGCLAQFTIMPATAWILAKLLGLNEELTIGMILVGCCPGGTASNVIAYLAKGDLALSVGMTAVSTILAPILTPLLTWLYAGTFVNVNVTNMFLSILWVVIIPIIAGFTIRHWFSKFADEAVAYLPAFSSIAIALIVAIVVTANSAKILSGGIPIIIAVILHNICGLSLGYLLGRILKLEHAKRVAISIEVGMQNSGLASSLAATHFAAFPMATIPGALFSVWHNISGAIMARIYARKAKE